MDDSQIRALLRLLRRRHFLYRSFLFLCGSFTRIKLFGTAEVALCRRLLCV